MKNVRENTTNQRSHNDSVSELSAKHRFYVHLNTHKHVHTHGSIWINHIHYFSSIKFSQHQY